MKNSQADIDKLSQEIINLKRELTQTREKLKVAEETLQAIQTGEVDALNTEEGARIFPLQGADYMYQLLVEQMGEGAATISDDGLILYCNQKLSELLNYPLKNLIGSSLESFISKKDQKAFVLLLEKIRKKENLTLELCLIKPENQTETPVKLSITKLEIDNISLNSVIITDITESKVKEATKLNQVLNKAIAAINRYRAFPDRTWIMDYWSEGCERLLGYTSAELLINPDLWKDNIHPEDLLYFIQKAFENNSHQKTIDVEYRFRHKDTTFRWITSNQLFEWDEINNYWLVTAILFDTTKRKNAEMKIAEQATLIDIVSDAIFVHDLEDKILFWNKGAENLYGWKQSEILGQTTHSLFNLNQEQLLKEAVSIVLEKGSWHGEIQEITKTGKKIIVASSKTLIKYKFSTEKSILVVNTDITEKKQLEKQFYHIQRLESLGTLASGIAHDFNNILTPILGVSQMLPMKFTNVDEKTQRMFTLLNNSAKRAINLVKQILSFSRVEEGQYSVLQIESILSEIINVVEQTFPKSIKLSTHISSELSTISADATQLHQVFLNLIINARDAMKSGGILTISAENSVLAPSKSNLPKTSTQGLNLLPTEANFQDTESSLDANNNYVSISIADTGVGIPPELLEQIFEPFFTTKEVGKGTGLGLSTVAGIIKNHGGFVNVYSELGKGTKFTVFLPAIEKEVAPSTIEKEIVRGNGELILIVDDETAIQEMTKTALENLNYRTLIANDGIEALSIYREQPQEIMVILLDIMMPNLDGINAIEALQKINPKVKIIASSGLITNRKWAKKAGVSSFLLKPYSIEQLSETITQLIFTDKEKSSKIISSFSQNLSNKEILKTSLGNMSLEWLQRMYDASYCVDADVMLELIEEIPLKEIALANALKDLIHDFNIDIIMELTSSLL